MEKIKEAIRNDLELYFYLYRDKVEWDLAVANTYLDRARTDRMSFQNIIEGYCLDHHIHIYDREVNKHGDMVFYLKKDELSVLKPKNGIYDTSMTTRKQ